MLNTYICHLCKERISDKISHMSKNHKGVYNSVEIEIERYLLNTDDGIRFIKQKFWESGNQFVTEDLILNIQRRIYPDRSYRLFEGKGISSDKKFVDFKKIKEFLIYNKNKIFDLYDGSYCSIIGCKDTTPHNKIYYINKDENNFLISNLIRLCSEHIIVHNEWYNQTPFVSVDKMFTFDSCHRLYDYVGKCQRDHGHLYSLRVTIKKRIDIKTDMVIDFGDLKKMVKEHIVNEFDHYNLNDKILEFQTTAENMVYWIWNKLEKDAELKGLVKIELWETPSSKATLTAEDILNSVYINSYYRDIVEENV